jgi:hypothetical protein
VLAIVDRCQTWILLVASAIIHRVKIRKARAHIDNPLSLKRSFRLRSGAQAVSTVTLDLTRLGIYPLCLNQERALLARALNRQSSEPASLMRFGFRVAGRLDAGTLRDALHQLMSRHPSLRASFSENMLVPPHERKRRVATFVRTGILESGVLVQTIHEDAVPTMAELDWTGMPEHERQEALINLARDEGLRQFNSSDPSRMRASLIRESVDQGLLILTFDHVVLDGFSAALIRKELRHLLTCRPDPQIRARAEVAPLDCCAFAIWQNRALPTSYFRASIAFWRDQWAKFAPYRISYEDLPFSFHASREGSHTFAAEHTRLGESESAALRTAAIAMKTTVFTVCAAALASVLSEYVGRPTVAFWTQLLNRVQPGALDSIGLFVNSHLLGFDVPPEMTGRDVVRQASSVMAAALVHQELPLSYLWSALGCAPRFPDVQVLIDFRSTVVDPLAEDSSILRLERLELPEATTPRHSNLIIDILDDQGSIGISATYSTGRFSKSGVGTLLRDLQDTVARIAEEPDTACGKGTTQTRQPDPTMAEFVVRDSACIPLAE